VARRQLGQLEAEVLAALAAAGDFVGTAELRVGLAGDPAYTTVNTILFRLHDKGLVTRERVGRRFRYRLVVDEARLVSDRMHDHLRFASDPSSVLRRFVRDLSPEQARRLRELLDEQEGGE
jgi:predicted transcriptional regulator